VVVQPRVQYMVRRRAQTRSKDAFYKLDDPEVQMKSYAFRRGPLAHPTMDLDEAYADADTISPSTSGTLQTQMADYGYAIIKALINATSSPTNGQGRDEQPINARAAAIRRRRQAQGEGDKTLRIKKAEAESSAMRLHGEGVGGRSERPIAAGSGLVEVLADEDGIDPMEALGILALDADTMDTIRSVGEHGNMPARHCSSRTAGRVRAR